MYLLHHAFANLKRNRGRNILLGIVIFLIIALTAISTILHATSNLIIQNYKESIGSEVQLQNMDTAQTKALSMEQLLSFSNSDMIKSKAFLAKVGYVPKNLQVFDDDKNKESFKGYLYGSSREDINDDFQKGTRKIIAGSWISDPFTCLISKDFANLNNLQIGDTLTLQNNQGGMEISLQVRGIYDDVSLQANTNPYQIPLTNRSNEIFASLDTLLQAEIFQSYGSLDIKMYLKEPGLLEAYTKELKEKGLPEGYEVITNAQEYEHIIAPVEHFAAIAQLMTFGVLGLGAALLTLISIMVMKERTYEIGVLRAIGMKKKHVIYCLLSESLMLTTLCLLLGLSVAQLAAQPIANALIAAQIPYESINEASANLQSLKNLHAALDAATMIEISLLALALAMITGACSILYTLRYEPMKILNKNI